MPLYRLQVKSLFPGGSLHGTNTWHIRQTTPFTGGVAPSITNVIKGFYDGIKVNFGLPYKWTWDGTLAEVATATPSLVAASSGWTVTGSSGGGNDSGPAGVGFCVVWRSSLATKRGRGRTFITPVPAGTFQADGTIVDSYLVTYRAAVAALVSASLADGNGAVSVFSQVDQVGRDVINGAINDRVAWLSSRRA